MTGSIGRLVEHVARRSTVHGQIVGSLVRRGINEASVTLTQPTGPRFGQVEKEEHQSLYVAPDAGEASGWEIGSIVFVAIIAMLVYASVKYTLGQVVSSMVMIEQPEALLVPEAKYTDSAEPDAPPSTQPALDEEFVAIKQQALTSSIRKTMIHLHRTAGWAARWRGLGSAIIYCAMHGVVVNILDALVTFLAFAEPFALFLSSIAATVLLSRFHMAWTHDMVSMPTNLLWHKRIVKGRYVFKALALPSFVYAVAQNLAVVIPVGTFLAWGPIDTERMDKANIIAITARILICLSLAALTSLVLVLPASVALTRIEASFLPANRETVVPCDRTLNGAIDLDSGHTAVAPRDIFAAGWLSFDRSSRLRVFKFYVKMLLTLALITLISVASITSMVYTIGPDRLRNFVSSRMAQVFMVQAQAQRGH